MSAPTSSPTNISEATKELQDALNGFMTLSDTKILEDEAVPIQQRSDVTKNATDKVLEAINKLEPILKDIDVNNSDNKSNKLQDAQIALKNAKTQFTGLDAVLKNIKEDNGNSSTKNEANSFDFGGLLKKVTYKCLANPSLQLLPGVLYDVAKETF
ncbi:hypothetical protein CPB83DRAFT_905873 [Crepidotus variabilis]|uniref:Uncharacterized protein n=1 Tax=Crepidotus variabilis TaxID=179855 RepID=A0A9P6EHJ0_9AGAR|nr:hypothetical protein CPB83DRAFT_905873 [Crepidotus variabilis]